MRELIPSKLVGGILLKWQNKDIRNPLSLSKASKKAINSRLCRICNLEFLLKRHNVAKGQTLDVESEELKSHIALNLFKDFSTGLYQISIGFNDDVYFWNEKTNELKPANSLFLLYDCDYRLVINDAEQILLEYQTERKIGLGKLKFVDYKIEFAPQIQFTEQEVDEIINGNRWYVERDGEIYFVKGKNNWILDVHYKEGWETPEK